jgi:hypothetical protein
MAVLLEDAVAEIYPRILRMEELVVPDTYASPEWIYQQQKVPYWINRISGLTSPEVRKWDIEVTMRLILSHISQANAGSVTPQVDSWKFIPRIMDYFYTNKLLEFMDGTTKTRTKYVDPIGISIESPDGMDVFFDRYTNSTQVFAEFALVVPISI